MAHPVDRVSMCRATGIYQTILNHPDLDTFDMSTLRLAVTGAAAIPVEIVQMRERSASRRSSRDMASPRRPASPPCAATPTIRRHRDDTGRAIPDVEVRIVDPDGEETPGRTGRDRRPGLQRDGRLPRRSGKTAETIDADGSLHTGDIGVMDAAGNDITDRVKDMFINGGFNAYPAEIESLMLAHPDIGNVAVIGVRRSPGRGRLRLVVRSRTSPDPAEIIGWCRAEMANYKCPRRVEIVDSLLLNASNKVLKPELRDRAIAARAGIHPDFRMRVWPDAPRSPLPCGWSAQVQRRTDDEGTMTDLGVDHFERWWEDEATAEAMIPLMGRLYCDNDVILYIFGKKLTRTSIEIMKAHRHARTSSTVGRQSRRCSSSWFLRRCSSTRRRSTSSLPQASRPPIPTTSRRTCTTSCERDDGHGRLLEEPTDVVLYGSAGSVGSSPGSRSSAGSGAKLRLRDRPSTTKGQRCREASEPASSHRSTVRSPARSSPTRKTIRSSSTATRSS